MKKSIALSAVAIALLTGQAWAADMPMRAPVYKAPAVAAAVFSWTGFYVGGNVGYGWGTVKPGTISFYDPIDTFAGSIPGINYDVNGVIGGGQIGYNQQFGNFVLGLEGDFSGTGIKGSVSDPVAAYSATTRLEWLSTVRGRVGVAFDRVLAYVTGGVAIGSVKTTLNDDYGVIITTNSTETHVGWTAGGGIEAALTQNWTARAEFLYVDLGSKEHNFYEPAPGWPRISANASMTAGIVRGGFNYKF